MNESQNQESFDQEALQKLFDLQPDNRMTPNQIARHALFPRWEIITPAPFDPVHEENQMLQDIFEAHEQDQEILDGTIDPHPGH